MCSFMLCVKNNLVISMQRHHGLQLSREGGVGWGGGTQQVLYGEAVPQGRLSHIL